MGLVAGTVPVVLEPLDRHLCPTGSRIPKRVSLSDLPEVTSPIGVAYPPAPVRRLFSTFAHGAPGAGLLLIRVVFGTTLVYKAAAALTGKGGLMADLTHCLPGALGLLLLVGLWTPLTGTLIAIDAVWQACLDPSLRWQALSLGAVGAGVALLGPGAWSIDARLFGWKRIEIAEEHPTDNSQPPSS